MTNLKSSMNCVRFSSDGENFVSSDNEGLTYVWSTNFYDYRQAQAEEKVEQGNLASQIYGNEKNGDIGGALGITEENLVMEQLSLKLESFVSKINTISDNILSMEEHLSRNEGNTRKLLDFLERNETNNNRSGLQEDINTRNLINLPFESLANS
jgi:hypothetical protein